MFGVLLVQKPAGLTSHDVVNDVRRRFGTRRVGHAGTLDPMATGLLVIAVGPATRFLQYLPLEPKEYVGEITFGFATDTYDAEGTPGPTRPVPADLGAAIEAHLPAFRGLISQLPPAFSAVKVKGKALYRYARAGEEVHREPRTVHVGVYAVEALMPDKAVVRIECSGGTYIRSLANDLGEAIGCGAHLSALKRTRVGRFRFDEGRPLEEAGPEHLIPLRDALPPMPLVQLDARATHDVREGRQIRLPEPPEGPLVALLEPGGTVFSVARARGELWQPECVIPAEVAPGG